MSFAGLSYLAIFAAAVASWLFGALWYTALGKAWMDAVGFTEPPKPTAAPFVISFLAELLMAYFLAGLIGHLGEVTVWRALVSAFFVWLAFVATTTVVNHRYQNSPWSLTLIDGGHWLGVLLIQGLVIGLIGA